MQALRAGANRNPERQRQNCSVWLELLADPAPTIGDQSVFLLSNAGSRSLTVPCTEAWTSMIDQLLARPALDVRPAELVYLLDKRAAPELKPRVASVCRKVLENTAAREHARAGAVQCLDVADPDAHTYLERFEADPAPKVQAEVKRVRAKPRKTP